MTVMQPAPDLRLEIRVCGGTSIAHGGMLVPIAHRKARALIAYLALSDSGREARERIVGLLWSESAEEKARASLRQSLHEIREAFDVVGFAGFSSTKLDATLDLSRVRVDIRDAIDEIALGRVPALLAAQNGEGLEFLNDLGSVDPAFYAWCLARRQALLSRLTTSLEDRMRDETLPLATRETFARALVKLDASHEGAVRLVMQARAEAGDIGGALNAYKALWDVLDDIYDVEPSTETQLLVARIKLAQPAAPQIAQPQTMPAPLLLPVATGPTAAPPARTRMVVTVEPFDLAGLAQDSHYLVQGFRRDLIATLVRFREWTIRDGGGPVGALTDAAGPVDEYVVEASGFAHAGELRVALMLRERATNYYVWSERLSLSTERWLDLQQTVVGRLAAALNLQISQARLQTIAAASQHEPLAYDQWLRGQEWIFTWRIENAEADLARYREIAQRFPNFAPAYSSLAQIHNGWHFRLPGTMRTADVIAQAVAWGTEATRLDPMDARGHLALGWAQAFAGRHDRAAIHHDIAIELNDNDAWTMMSAGLGASARRDFERARTLAKRSLGISLVPTASQLAYQAQIAFMCGDYEEAVDAGRRSGDVIPSMGGWRIASLGLLGRKTEAAGEIERFYGLIRDLWAVESPPDEAAITRWFLHLFPFASQDDWQRTADGLARAGMPVGPRDRLD